MSLICAQTAISGLSDSVRLHANLAENEPSDLFRADLLFLEVWLQNAEMFWGLVRGSFLATS